MHIRDLEVLETEPTYKVPSSSLPSSFWQGATIEELAKAQGVRPVGKLEDLCGDFWPEEDVDAAIRQIYEWRRLDQEERR